MPTGLIVADFLVPASVPSAELCLEDIVANTKGKRKKGRPNNVVKKKTFVFTRF